ncbi:hypothetical protein [Nitratireductor rhodophyticola]|uniref:hypothetical protein n=1 Tax=Nitratireductor rhodophyticola TaxID=2854036 RepID=UPI003BAC3C22
MDAMTIIPSFSRVEITTRGKTDLEIAASELRRLADELDFIAANPSVGEDEKLILAHHNIRRTSKKLRNGGMN